MNKGLNVYENVKLIHMNYLLRSIELLLEPLLYYISFV